MNEKKSSAPLGTTARRIAVISDQVFGPPTEMNLREAQEILQATGIDAQHLNARLHARFDRLAKNYAAGGERIPKLLKQALADFRPGVTYSRREREVLREAQTSIRRILMQVKRLPELLVKQPNAAFSAAYRNKKELSERDKKLLEELAKDLDRRGTSAKRSKPHHE